MWCSRQRSHYLVGPDVRVLATRTLDDLTAVESPSRTGPFEGSDSRAWSFKNRGAEGEIPPHLVCLICIDISVIHSAHDPFNPFVNGIIYHSNLMEELQDHWRLGTMLGAPRCYTWNGGPSTACFRWMEGYFVLFHVTSCYFHVILSYFNHVKTFLFAPREIAK